jgi:pyruvate dehydrogenase E2 component (dihydrolipoamide acetyltransferase)
MTEADDATSAPPPARHRKDRAQGGARFLSPAVRRIATERGIDPARIRGTGHGGRVTRDDLLTIPVDVPAEPSPATGAVDVIEPFSPLRRTTARRLLDSTATAAHAHVVVECDYHRIDLVRRPAGLTYLPFVARAVVDALREFPLCNATVTGDEITIHDAVHLGIAVDLGNVDLVVPVVHDAHTLRLRALSAQIGVVAQRARGRQLQPDDVSGGTFTITNPGPFGTVVSIPVINVPQVAILATDAVRPRPVVVPGADGTDAIAIHPVGVLALGFDHRVVTLTTASAFLARVRDIVEGREWSAEL